MCSRLDDRARMRRPSRALQAHGLLSARPWRPRLRQGFRGLRAALGRSLDGELEPLIAVWPQFDLVGLLGHPQTLPENRGGTD